MTTVLKPMSADEFLIWRQGREGCWEFVDGAPRRKFCNPADRLAGATRNHALVAANLLAALRPRLRGGRRVPLGSQLAVRTCAGVRQPDVLVECGETRGSDLQARDPKAVFEVLSASTRGLDLIRKDEEYRQLPALAHLVILEADLARALIWTRTDSGWDLDEVAGLDAVIRLPDIGSDLPMSEVYEDVELEAE